MSTRLNGYTQLRGSIHTTRCDGSIHYITISSVLNLYYNSYWWYMVSCTDIKRNIILPDATTLLPGWVIVIKNNNTNGLSLQVNYNDSSKVIDIVEGQIYEFVCIDNSTTNGLWSVIYSYTNLNPDVLASSYLSNMGFR